jgi:hypothetical protein
MDLGITEFTGGDGSLTTKKLNRTRGKYRSIDGIRNPDTVADQLVLIPDVGIQDR